MNDRRTGDWRTDSVKMLYNFCRDMHILPSQTYDEDPVIMSDMLVIYAEELKERQRLSHK